MGKRAVLILALAVALAYGNSLRNGFSGDDEIAIVRNTFYSDRDNFFRLTRPDVYLRDGSTYVFSYLDPATVFDGPALLSFRPVAGVSFFVNRWLWGLRPAGHHLASVLLHLGFCLLLFFTARRATGDVRTAFWSSLVFAVHPVNAETVNVASFASTIIAASFCLAALWAWARGGWGGSIAAVGFYAAGMLTKESVLLLPVLLFVYDGVMGRWNSSARPKITVGYAGMAAALGVFLYLYLVPFQGMYHGGLGTKSGLAAQAVLSLKLFSAYILFFAWPFYVKVLPNGDFSLNGLEGAKIVIPAVMFLAVLAWSWVRDRKVFLFLGWFVLFLIPVVHLVPLANMVAYRYVYFSMAGLAVAAVMMARRIFPGTGHAPRRNALGGMLIAGMALLTASGNGQWRDNMSFAKALMAAYPRTAAGYFIQGQELFRQGKCAEAMIFLDKSLSVGQDGPWTTYYMLGMCSADPAAARDYLVAAQKRAPQCPLIYAGLGVHHYRQKEYPKAMPYLIQSLSLGSVPMAYEYLIRSYIAMGEPAGAEKTLEEAQTRFPRIEWAREFRDVLGGQE